MGIPSRSINYIQRATLKSHRFWIKEHNMRRSRLCRIGAALLFLTLYYILIARGRISLFPWLIGDQAPNYQVGLVYFGLGSVGSLIVVYLLLGALLPPTGATRAIELELTQFKKMRQDMLALREQYVQGRPVSKEQLQAVESLSRDLENTVSQLEERASRERWRLLFLGLPLYAALGGLFAAALVPETQLSPRGLSSAFLIGFFTVGLAIGLDLLDAFLASRSAEKKRPQEVSEVAEPTGHYDIESIEGIGSLRAEKLKVLGIATTKDLVKMGATDEARRRLVEALRTKSGEREISNEQLLKWARQADLMQVRGVGGEYADLLYKVGVETVEQLAARQPPDLHQELLRIAKEKKAVRRPPSLKNVADWVAQARELSSRVVP
jgi:predicted flap endonuclease-1-like 5' DNA nuclease